MNRAGAHRYSAPSKATPNTVCQKCLKKGHYSYECTASSNDRPYAARPSRTQQLLNPKLAPPLTNDAPNELLNKKGVADQILAKRGRENSRRGSRSRSPSSASSTSVSTVSTNKSRSPSPPPRSRRLESPVPRRKTARSPPLSASPEDRRRAQRRRSRNSRSASPDRRGDRNGRRARSPPGGTGRQGDASGGRPRPPRESLSPYSRRLALTAAMGRS